MPILISAQSLKRQHNAQAGTGAANLASCIQLRIVLIPWIYASSSSPYLVRSAGAVDVRLDHSIVSPIFKEIVVDQSRTRADLNSECPYWSTVKRAIAYIVVNLRHSGTPMERPVPGAS